MRGDGVLKSLCSTGGGGTVRFLKSSVGENLYASCNPRDLSPHGKGIATALTLMQSRTDVMPWYRLVGLWIPGWSTGATWVIAHSRQGGVWRGGSTTLPPFHTVAGKADENGQSFVSGSRSSCGIRPSVPALAHEGESLMWRTAARGMGAYPTAPGIAIDWVVSRSSFQKAAQCTVRPS